MRSTNSARTALRTATAAHHDRVDALFSRADLSDRDGYARFLTAQAAAHIAVEDALTRADAASVVDDWPERRRAALLRDDLAALGTPFPATLAPPAFDSAAAILGGVYVLEGSRLGGAMLARALPRGFPGSFLSATAPAAWRSLLALLDTHLTDDVRCRTAINAARDVFTLFELSGRLFLQPEASWKISDLST